MGFYTEVGESAIAVRAAIPAIKAKELCDDNFFSIRAVAGEVYCEIGPLYTGADTYPFASYREFSGGNDDLAAELATLIERIKTAFPEATFTGYAELESSEGWHSMIEVTPDGNVWLRDGGEITYTETRRHISAGVKE